MLVDTLQKNIAQTFILERYFFCFHLSGSNMYVFIVKKREVSMRHYKYRKFSLNLQQR